MFIFHKARSPTQTLNALDEYLRTVKDEPVKWIARTVSGWGNEFSYDELAAVIQSGQLDELIDWQARWAQVVNDSLAPQWISAIAAASAKATKGKTILSDSDWYVQSWIQNRGGELITQLSEESRRAVMNIILRGQGLSMAPRDVAKQVRPLIGLNDRQAQANVNYRDKVYQQFIDNGLSHAAATAKAEAAALKYAGKQHRYRAETIVLTENAFAYNRGAHMGVSQSIAQGLMGRCEMVWTTAGTNRVCSRCLALKDTVVGHTDESGVTIPPLHPRCRCAIIYREVGLPQIMQPKVYRSFKDATEANDYFGNAKSDTSKPFGQWCSAITKTEKAAVKKYTSNYYREMNGWLRGFKQDTDFSAVAFKKLKNTILHCEEALAKSELPDDILVHRQAGYGMLDLYKKAPNGIFLDEGFTSSTPIKGSFSGSIDIEIQIPAGKGAGMWVDPISEFPGENEFLINRGTKFKVLEIDESGRRPLVKLEVIGREPREVLKMLKRKQSDEQRRSDKFTWTPAEVKVQDEHGNWIRGDKFLKKKANPPKQ